MKIRVEGGFISLFRWSQKVIFIVITIRRLDLPVDLETPGVHGTLFLTEHVGHD